jgi:ABC-type glycerol-3-phosphate transport system substrate-binding protein
MKSERDHSVSRRSLVTSTLGGAAAVALGQTSVSANMAAILQHKQAPALLSQDQTLTIVFNGTQVSPVDQSMAEGFREKFPDANVEYMPIQATDHDDFFAKVLTLIASGTIPDLMTVATEGTQLFAAEGLTAPLDDYVNADKEELQEFFSDVHPSLVEAMMYEGSLYELPQNFNAANMYINTGLFEEKGIEFPADDWTKDDFTEIAKAITKEGGGPPFGYAWTNRMWGGWMPWIFVNGSNLLTESRAPGGEWMWETFYADVSDLGDRSGGWRWEAPQANAAANVEALEFLVELANEGVTPAVSEGGGDLLQGFFTSGSLGMTPAGGFWAGGMHQAGMAPDQFDVQLFPKWQSQRHQFGTGGLVLMQESESKDLAWEYMKYYISVPAMEVFFAENTNTPTRRSMMTAERYEPTGPAHWNVFYDTLDKHPDTAPIPAPPEFNEVSAAFLRHTGAALSGSQTPQEALDAMQRDLEEVFK